MKKQQARNLYFQSELSQTRIAELLDVDRKTIYLWIKEGRWAEIKKSAQHMPSILAGQYYSQLLAINQMILNREEQPYPTQQEADIIRKLTLTIKNIKDGQTIGETIEVLMNFVNQLSKTDLALAKQILPHTDKYIRDYANPSILRPIEKEAEETQEDNTTPQQEQPPQSEPQNPPQPLSQQEGSLRGTKQSLTTQSETHDHSPQSETHDHATQPPIESQTPDSQNIEPAIVELSNCQIAELSKTGYKWAMNEQPIFTMQEALIRYRQGDWSDNTWLRFLKWHSQQNEENLSTSK